MTAPVVFLDTETTGLDPDVHSLWEVALIVDGAEHVYRIQPDLKVASPDALRITRFYERTLDPAWQWNFGGQNIARDIALYTGGRHLVAAVPSFDAPFLARYLRLYGLQPAWHYHLIDVEALAAGKLGIAPPWDSADLAKRLGIDSDRPDFAKHTAMGDARWAKAIYDAVLA